MAVPHRDILALAGYSPGRLLIVALLGLAAAVALAQFLAGRIARSLTMLAEESQRIGQLDLSTPSVQANSSLVELRKLGSSSGAMRTALREHAEAREQANADLVASEARFRGTFDQVAVGVVHVAPDGRMLLVNQKMCDILGHTNDQLLKLRFTDFTHPEDRGPDMQRVQRMLADYQGPEQWEKRYIHSGGQVVWAEVTTSLQLDHGRPLYFITVVQDVGERKLLENHLRQSQKLEAVGRLAGGIAHDFNNLLTVILSYSQVIRASLGEGHCVQPDLAELEQAAESAAALTHQLLAFARREIISPRVVDVNHEVSASLKLIERLIGENVELTIRLQGGPQHVLIDPIQLQQVLVNLSINARDSMTGGGQLTISVDRLAHEGRQEVEIRVRDTGQGMSPEVAAQAFEPFFTTKGVGRGTGLGLSTCYGIVTQAGGRITIDSAPGSGTAMVLRLPATDELPEQRSETSSADSSGGGGTILLVEDEAQIRTLMTRVLTERGFRVTTATDGAQALEILAGRPRVDLVVTDVIMSGISGGELVDRIREHNPDQRVLFVSGYAQSELAGKVPADTHLLAKPYTPKTLIARIREVLSG